MTPDHIHRLLGGYATGTLSEKQRKLLFEAALEDQDLFDELARDQALKELLEVPGVKQRLLESIETPAPRDWWRHPLPWLMGGSVMAISAGLMALVFLTPSGSKPAPSKPVEVAQARPPVTSEAPSSPAPSRGAPQPPPKVPNEPKTTGAVRQEPVPSPPAPAQPELQNEPKAAPTAIGQLVDTEKMKTTSAPPPAAPPPQAAPGVVGGNAAPAGPAPAPRPTVAARAAVPLARFAFDYSVHDGVLRIVPGSDGYLLVRATVGPIDRLILNTAHVVRATPAELRVPDGASSMVVLFSARPVQEDSTDNLAARAATRTEPTGTVEDPRSSINSRLEVRIVVSGK